MPNAQLSPHHRARLGGACLFIGMLLALAPSPSRSEMVQGTPYQYVSPRPGARLVQPSHNIAIRDGRLIDRSAVAQASLSVRGSMSGIHFGNLVLSDDGKTLVFVPERSFSPGETVEVHLERGPTTIDGAELPPLAFRFEVSPTVDRERSSASIETPLTPMSPGTEPSAGAISGNGDSRRRTVGDDLPPGYPDLYVVSSDNPEPGEIFVTPFGFGAPPPPDNRGPLVIVDNLGMPLFYQSLEKGGLVFTPQQDKLTYWDYNREKFYVMDHSYAVIDSFVAGNGAITDFHDLQLLPNGHALITAEENVPVDMSVIVPGGDPNAIVIGAVVQILDASKNVIFEWRSLDHIDILDADPNSVNFTGPVVNYFVINALDLDQDGNILVSSRFLNQIVKVNSSTADVIWRLGSNGQNNSFTFVNDPRGFSHQHDIRRLPSGNVTLFDNGNWLNPLYSRAVEYELDEVNMTATLVWEHRNVPDHFGRFMGGVQRRESGGTMIAWGGIQAHPKVTDLHPDGTTAFELSFTHPPGNWGSYRAFRAPWQTTRFETDVEAIDFGPVPQGQSAVQSMTITNNWDSDVEITSFVSTDVAFYVLDAVPLTVPVGGAVDVDVVFEPPGGAAFFEGSLYVRSVRDTTELVAQRVELEGTALPVPVLLSGFTAEPQGRAVLLSWFTSFEYLHEGFNVYRSRQLMSGYTKLNDDLLRGRNPYSYLDRNVQPSTTYYYKLGAVDLRGDEVLHFPTTVTTPPWELSTALSAARPTPFRKETRITFTLAARAEAKIAVYDVTGRMVRLLVREDLSEGDHAVSWDGRDDRGLRVAGGTYFVKLTAGEVTHTRKVVYFGGS